jgi:hypothetical protein
LETSLKTKAKIKRSASGLFINHDLRIIRTSCIANVRLDTGILRWFLLDFNKTFFCSLVQPNLLIFSSDPEQFSLSPFVVFVFPQSITMCNNCMSALWGDNIIKNRQIYKPYCNYILFMKVGILDFISQNFVGLSNIDQFIYHSLTWPYTGCRKMVNIYC